MTTHRHTFRHAAGIFSLAVTMALLACSPDDLVNVDTPDIITVDAAQSVQGAQAFRISAIGNFARFIGGDQGGGSPLGVNLTSGMLADEIFSARAGTEHMDNRTINPNSFPIDTWTQVGRTYATIHRAINLIEAFPPATGKEIQLAELRALKGYVLTITAELYCNGLPFWIGEEGTLESENLTTAEMYTRALAQFDSALAGLTGQTGAAASRIVRMVSVGRGRTLVDQGNYAAAATAVAGVATDTLLNYKAEFSKNSTGIVNAIFDWMRDTRNFGASDREGGNGLNFVSAVDPRARVDGTQLGRGQDGTMTPLMNHYATSDAQVTVSSGIEARMIEAEAQLAANNVTGFMETLNAARTAMSGLAPLTDPGTTAARVDLLFRERAFWMYLTGHRLGDMRRLIRQYGRDAETVFPAGAYFKGGVYGPDVTLIPQQSEQNNPNWPGCTDRNP
jgi:starch-binding outer membrane protein, SusD/RagB family